MNSDIPNPDPENASAPDAAQSPSERPCGILPQSAQGASSARRDSSHDGRSEFSWPAPTAVPHPPAHSFDSDAYEFHMALELKRSEGTGSEQPDYDYEEVARERELLLDDLASDSDDFCRSAEEGWFYSDDD